MHHRSRRQYRLPIGTSLVDLLSTGRPDDAVVVTDAGPIERGAVLTAVAVVADAVREKAGTGRRVGVLCPNDERAVVAWFATWAAGCSLAPLNPRVPDVELRSAVARLQVDVVLLTDDDAARDLGVPSVVVAPLDGGARRSPRPSVPSMAELPDDVALVQSTSGTTGPPKPVPLYQHVVLDLLDRVATQLGAAPKPSGPRAPNLVPVSLSLWAGIYSVLFALRVGASVVLMERFEPRPFADLVARHGIRSVVLPPAAMAMLVDDEAVTSLAPLRYVRSITAPLSPDLARRFVGRFGVGVLNGYGQTELGGEVIGWTRGDWTRWGEAKLGAVGRPHPGVELRVVAEDGHDLGVGEVGELQVRTPLAATGEAVAARRTPDGFLRTGDLARLDPDGFVWIDGRIGEMINRGGLKVQPAEVEEVLRGHPTVLDAAVAAAPDDRLGEVPWAFVVADGELSWSDLDAWAHEHLAAYKVPVGATVVAELPRTEIGKVALGELRERAAEERRRASEAGA